MAAPEALLRPVLGLLLELDPQFAERGVLPQSGAQRLWQRVHRVDVGRRSVAVEAVADLLEAELRLAPVLEHGLELLVAQAVQVGLALAARGRHGGQRPRQSEPRRGRRRHRQRGRARGQGREDRAGVPRTHGWAVNGGLVVERQRREEPEASLAKKNSGFCQKEIMRVWPP